MATSVPGPEVPSDKIEAFTYAAGVEPAATADRAALPLSEDRSTSSTANDVRDMKRLGKTQEMRRNFRKFATLSFTCIVMATFETLFVANSQALQDGGRAGFFWSYVWTLIGFGPVIATLAEMSSIAPTAGGQYHWISEFAPRRHQKFLSYFGGWMATLSWQASTAFNSYITGGLILGLLSLNFPNASESHWTIAWQQTLVAIAAIIIVGLMNIYGNRVLPFVQEFLMVVHVGAWITTIVIFSVRPTHVSFREAFSYAGFANTGGWSSMGLTLMVGQISAVFALISSDAAAHLAEEINDAGLTVPQAMFWSYIVNGVMGLVWLIPFVLSIVDVDAALNDPSGFPMFYALSQALPLRGINAFTGVSMALVLGGNMTTNASAARQTFAFARDRGLPLSGWLGRVHAGRRIPVNAILASCAISVAINLLNLGSSTAFAAIISLNLCSLMLTYAISASCLLHRRLAHPPGTPGSLPPGRWTLGERLGPPVNDAAVAYSLFVFFWSFWPAQRAVDAESMNYSVAIFAAVVLLALIMYALQGRFVYEGPVTQVRGYDEVGEDGGRRDGHGHVE